MLAHTTIPWSVVRGQNSGIFDGLTTHPNPYAENTSKGIVPSVLIRELCEKSSNEHKAATS